MKQVSVDRLKNGMLYYGYADTGIHLGTVGIMAGSVHDPPGKGGLAHLAEHCVFSGSEKYPSETVYLRYYEGHMGGPDESANVRTFFTSTFYGHDTLLWRPHLWDCADMVADLVKNHRINDEVVATEKAAVHNEYYLNGMDSPQSRAMDMARRLLYTTNPARNRIDAEMPGFEKLGLRDVRNFVRRFYVPKNMFVLLFGPKFQEVKKFAERHFDGWGATTMPTIDYDGSDNLPVLRSVVSKESAFPGVRQRHLVMAFPTEVYGSKDEEAIEILCRVLAYRLVQRIRVGNTDFNKGAYRVYVTPERSKYHGTIYVWFATVGSHETVLEYETIAKEEMKKLRETLISSAEMDSIRKNLEWQHRMAFRQIPIALCELVIEAAANGDEDLAGLHAYLPRLEKVTRRKIREVARKYLSPFYARALVSPD